MKQRFTVMVAALWWGSLTALGFVVVPMLFANLGAPAAAGAMAAKLFTAQTWLSTGCAMLLLLVLNKKDDAALALQAQAAMRVVIERLLGIVELRYEYIVRQRQGVSSGLTFCAGKRDFYGS